MRLHRFIKKYLHEIILTIIVGIIFVANYRPGTSLIGWDSLQTELNPWLGVKRAAMASWVEYQSFGFMSGMADAADLLRAVFIWIISFVLPQQLVRYFFHFLMLLLGGLGTLKLLQLLGFKEEKRIFSLIGSLFYLLNFGTIQIFYVPFEPYSIFFAMLPWEIWIFLRVIHTKHRSKKDWFLFILINTLATPQAYLQTFFVVYMLVLGCITLGLFVQQKSKNILKASVLLFTLILAINMFWILPQAYFLITSGNVVREAKINQIATEDVVYQNKEKGTLPAFFKFEGFYYDLSSNNNTSTKQLFAPWKNHFDGRLTQLIPFLIAAVIVVGLTYRSLYMYSMLLTYVLVCIALLNNTPIFEQVNGIVRLNGFINQMFRSPFTKFIVVYAVIGSYLFSAGLLTLHRWFKVSQRSKIPMVIAVCMLLMFYSLPAFTGSFFSSTMRVKIPTDYYKLIDYFNTQPKDKRIALFPDHTFWGWFATRWGYDGSGFSWWGIKQPIVSRTFDVWSNKSESYFWEVKNAVEAEDSEALYRVISKYNISYLVVDHSLLPVSATLKGLQFDRLESLLANNPRFTLTKHTDILDIYQVVPDKNVASFVSIGSPRPNIGPAIKITNKDVAYELDGEYHTDTSKPYVKYYPYLDLTTQTQIAGKKWKISENLKTFTLRSSLPPGKDYLVSKNIVDEPGSLFINNTYSTVRNFGVVSQESGSVNVVVPKQKLVSFNPTQTQVKNCSAGAGVNTISGSHDSTLVIRSEKKAVGCFGYSNLSLEQQYGYLVKVVNKNIQGRRLLFYILDETKKQAVIEDRLNTDTEYYLLYPKYRYGAGYSFVFNNNSYESNPAVNEISELSIYSMPLEEIKSLYMYTGNPVPMRPIFSDSFQTEKLAPFLYKIDIQKPADISTEISLYQQYHAGWIAYDMTCQNSQSNCQIFHTLPFLFGHRLNDHFIVDNWANGWTLPANSQTIVLFFWPQYLQYAGYILLIALWGVVLVYALTYKSQKIL